MAEFGPGLGIGLSAELNTARDLWMNDQRQQQLRAQVELNKAKQKDEATAAIMKNLRPNDSYKWHRLLADEVNGISANAVKKVLELKASGAPNWQNEMYTLENKYLQDITKLKSINEGYLMTEAASKTYDPGQYYTSENAKKGILAFNNAKDRADLYEKMKQFGVQNDDYFSLGPEGNVIYKAPLRINFDQTIKAKIPPGTGLFAGYEQVTLPGGGIKTQEMKQLPYTRQDMLEMIKEFPQNANAPEAISVEDIADEILSQPEAKDQWAERHGISKDDDAAIKDSLMKAMAVYSSPNVKIRTSQPRITKVDIHNEERSEKALELYSTPIDISGQGTPEGQTTSKEFSIKTPLHFEFSGEPMSVVIDKNYSLPGGKFASGSVNRSATAGRIFVAPKTTIDGRVRPVFEGEKIKPEGYGAFFQVIVGNQQYYIPADRHSLPLNQIAGSKYEVATIEDLINKAILKARTMK